MNLFDGKLEITEAYQLEDNLYKIVGNYVDNTGTFSTYDLSVGDIIYIDGSMLGYTLLRYKVKTINKSEMQKAVISVDATWDMIEGMEQVDPSGTVDGIIGALHSNGLTANITSVEYNGANEVLVARANSYQTMLLSTISGGGGNPPDLTEVNKRLSNLEEAVTSVQIEWEDLVKLSFE